jgi:hypothetical protein
MMGSEKYWNTEYFPTNFLFLVVKFFSFKAV